MTAQGLTTTMMVAMVATGAQTYLGVILMVRTTNTTPMMTAVLPRAAHQLLQDNGGGDREGRALASH
eukprot:COSAG06_NODE_15664_length_1054_cov_1.424084_2_plen_67_part_00